MYICYICYVFAAILLLNKSERNERSLSVALLCAGLLRRVMVYELERVLRVCNGFLCSMSVTYDGAVLLWQW